MTHPADASSLAILLAQCNFTVGAIEGNVRLIAETYEAARAKDISLIIFSEMCITGYPPEDLVLRRHFQEVAMDAVAHLAHLTTDGPAMLVGGLWVQNAEIYNACFLLSDGEIRHIQYKYNLPNYGVFDEKRVFAAGPLPTVAHWRGISLGLLICEDMWGWQVATHLKDQGAELLLCLNASPFELGKTSMRLEVASARARENTLPLLYVNQIGGQDELVFDGGSFAVDRSGRQIAGLSVFQEDSAITRWRKIGQHWGPVGQLIKVQPEPVEATYRAMVLGLKDYVGKNRFSGVVLGLSGGVDSALTAAVAVDALGTGRVRAIMLPSPYTSQESTDDAEECAAMLGIRLDTISIAPAMAVMEETLAPFFAGKPKDTTEENIQSRLRGNVLMSISNKEGLLLLTTGNKSEMSVGYATLYGDMCGGFSVLKDVYKTTVYKICEWLNSQGGIIPERILTKAPTAELKPGQTDQDTLPPYPQLDGILKELIEHALSSADIVAKGYTPETVRRVARLLYLAEYKRRQAPPGVKLTSMAFGRDRRYPMTNGWVE